MAYDLTKSGNTKGNFANNCNHLQYRKNSISQAAQLSIAPG